MSIGDDLKSIGEKALSAGAAQARAQGTQLKADFEALARPNLNAIIAQLAQITRDFVAGDIGRDQAKDDLGAQLDRIPDLILAAAELVLQAVQDIVNAVLNALKAGINAAAGLPLL